MHVQLFYYVMHNLTLWLASSMLVLSTKREMQVSVGDMGHNKVSKQEAGSLLLPLYANASNFLCVSKQAQTKSIPPECIESYRRMHRVLQKRHQGTVALLPYSTVKDVFTPL